MKKKRKKMKNNRTTADIDTDNGDVREQWLRDTNSLFKAINI